MNKINAKHLENKYPDAFLIQEKDELTNEMKF